jgi:nucleoside permease NupC
MSTLDVIVLLTIEVIVMFVAFIAIVDFSNDLTLTINEWVKMNIERVKNLFKKNKK